MLSGGLTVAKSRLRSKSLNERNRLWVSARACGPRNRMKMGQSQAIIDDGGEIDSTLERARPGGCLIRSVRDTANKRCVVFPPGGSGDSPRPCLNVIFGTLSDPARRKPMPYRIAGIDVLPLKRVRAMFPLPRINTVMIWHQRTNEDPGAKLFRDIVLECGRAR